MIVSDQPPANDLLRTRIDGILDAAPFLDELGGCSVVPDTRPWPRVW